MSEGVNFYVVPATTVNAMLNHLMEKPYREVAEIVKLMEGTIIQVPPQMNILRELSRAAAPASAQPDAPPPPPREGGPTEDAGNITDLRS
jgi:hypothetical protein